MPSKPINIIALISYLTSIGWLMALAMHLQERPKNEFSRFHLRQSFGVHAFFLLVVLAYQLRLSEWFIAIASIAVFIFWLIGTLAALQGHKRRLPFIGEFLNRNLKFIK